MPPDEADELLLVLTNVPDADAAEEIEHAIIGERLAACVNRLAPVRSTYRWQGAVERADEIPLLIKTTVHRWPALSSRLAELHPYDVPEIIAWPARFALPAYERWVRDSTAG